MTDRSSQPLVAETDDDALRRELRARGPIPRHVAIIMDGNGRWAKSKGKLRIYGHREGVESVRDIAEASAKLGVEVLTLYTFSTENWFRPATEVNALMSLLVGTIRKEVATLLSNQIQLRAIGDLDQLPSEARKELEAAMDETAAADRMVLNLALSYSGRWDITNAVRAIAREVAEGRLSLDAVDEEAVAGHLATAGLADPDLLIRTGGEFRVSNYLLWQIAYAELYITEDFWPDFRRQQLYTAIRAFQDRDRRFGRVRDDSSS
ncbi:MAG: isoprenyl transferase [Rhodothermales bacterium]